MSYINGDSFLRWIIQKLDGLTTLGLQKISVSVRDYTYIYDINKSNQYEGSNHWSWSTTLRCSMSISEYIWKYRN